MSRISPYTNSLAREFPPAGEKGVAWGAQALRRNRVTTVQLRKSLPQSADLIFVLAGRDYRKHYGLQLFRQGLAPKILFSVSRFEIRRFSKMPLPSPLDLVNLASGVPPPERHFFVLFEGANVQVTYVQPHRFGTLTEIESLERWLAGHQDVRSVLLISSSSHLRRVRICCRSLLGRDLEIVLTSPPAQPQTSERLSLLTAAFLESLKTVVYGVLLAFRRGRPRNNPTRP